MVAGVLVALVAVLGLVVFLGSREDSTFSGAGEGGSGGPGVLEPDRGAAHTGLADPGDGLPTSGAHAPSLPTAERRVLTADEVLHALELGNILIAVPGDEPPAELVALQETIAGPLDPALLAAGQGLLLTRAPPDRTEITALAWRRRLITNDATDPRLRAFAEAWLGKGARRSVP